MKSRYKKHMISIKNVFKVNESNETMSKYICNKNEEKEKQMPKCNIIKKTGPLTGISDELIVFTKTW